MSKESQKTQELIITKGLPGSGKTTWAKAWVLEDPKNRVRVNRDDIRHMLGPYWVPSREQLVSKMEESMILHGLIYRYSVVVDATNFKFDVSRYSNDKLKLVHQDFTDVPLETCIERDAKRGVGMVGKKVIEDMYNKYLKSKQ